MTGELLALEGALERIVALAGPPLPMEEIPVGAALGRVLAADVVAQVDLPPFDNSAMDGWAVRAADVVGATNATPATLTVVGESRAGAGTPRTVAAGEAIRIATGAPLPAGADAVVQVELTTPDTMEGPLPARVEVRAAVPVGASIRRRGEDVRAGATIVATGSRIGPAAIALAAGSGNAVLHVHRRPVVAVLATGDEVRPAGEPLPNGALPDANGPGIRALVAAAGAVPHDLGLAPDRLEVVEERLRAGIAAADLVVVSGGVSVGPYDVVKAAFERVGEIDLWRVAVQPGKPFALGTARAPDGRRVLLCGLPGNPVSSFVTFELFVRPILRRLSGLDPRLREVDRGVLLEPVGTSEGRRTFVRVRAERDADGAPARDGEGRLRLRAAGGQGSHVLSGLAAAEALAIVPEEIGTAPAGLPVTCWWLDRGAGQARSG